MEQYLPYLKNSKLFSSIPESEILQILSQSDFKIKAFAKNSPIFSVGEKICHTAIVLKGSVLLQNEDYWGNTSIIGKLKCSDIFGEVFSFLNLKSSVNAVALEDCRVLFFNPKTFLCGNVNCSFQFEFISNLLSHIAQKNIFLTSKINHMSKRTIRQKLLSYLSEQAQIHNSESFEISFNRLQLADFLSVDRSAMSKELCKMRDEGLLYFNKNRFTLIKKDICDF